jgi:peptidyl-prolyl cis-trans isomerase C
MLLLNRTYALIFLATGILCTAWPAGAEKTANDNVAMVNGTAISRSDLDRELKLWTDRMAGQGRQVPSAQVGAVRSQILEGMINKELLYQKSQQDDIEVDQETVDARYNAIKKRFETEAAFNEAIANMDMNEATIRTQIKKGLAIDELLKTNVVKEIEVTEEESQKYYRENPEDFHQAEQVKASHILIKVEPAAEEAKKTEALKKIEAVQGKLEKGDSFADLAKTYSEGPSKSQGGDLGYFKRGQMVKPFEDAAFSLDVDQVSGVVETQFGYHIIKVTDKKPASTSTYPEVKDQLQQQLKRQKTQQAVEKYVDDLRKEAKIEKF